MPPFHPPRVVLTSESIKLPSNLSFKSKQRSFLVKISRAGKRKSMKVVMLQERFALVPPHLPTYVSVRAPASLWPSVRYCDLTGLPTQFTDPKTKLHFLDSATFQRIRQLSQDAINGILAKRGADISLH